MSEETNEREITLDDILKDTHCILFERHTTADTLGRVVAPRTECMSASALRTAIRNEINARIYPAEEDMKNLKDVLSDEALSFVVKAVSKTLEDIDVLVRNAAKAWQDRLIDATTFIPEGDSHCHLPDINAEEDIDFKKLRAKFVAKYKNKLRERAIRRLRVLISYDLYDLVSSTTNNVRMYDNISAMIDTRITLLEERLANNEAPKA